MKTIYLDNNSTTKPAPQVVEAMTEAMTNGWANPSSIHRPGQCVRQRVDLARHSIANLLGCNDRDVVFTSGGTESNNLAILGSLHAQPDRKVIVTSRLEHSSIRELSGRLAGNGYEIVWIPNDEDGRTDLNFLADVVKRRSTEIALVSIMWVNNETGVTQPTEQIGSLCREHGVRFHTDGTQRVGKLPVNISKLPIDLLTCTGHKFHGPKGIGALYVKPRMRLVSHIVGGPQERHRRGGTENVPCILGLAAAADLASNWLLTDGPQQAEALRKHFEECITENIDRALVNGENASRQWNTSNISFCGHETEAILMMFSERGVCASGGSACSSGSLEPSAVLQAMGRPPECISGSVRFSMSRETTYDEIDEAVRIISSVVNQLRENSTAHVAQHA